LRSIHRVDDRPGPVYRSMASPPRCLVLTAGERDEILFCLLLPCGSMMRAWLFPALRVSEWAMEQAWRASCTLAHAAAPA